MPELSSLVRCKLYAGRFVQRFCATSALLLAGVSIYEDTRNKKVLLLIFTMMRK